MTDKQQIQEWINRFMAGSATELEEQQLADYFCSATDVPEEWLPYAIMLTRLKMNAWPISMASVLPTVMSSSAKCRKRWLL